MYDKQNIFLIKLKDIIDLKVLQDMQDKFFHATGLDSLIVDAEGEPVTQHSNFSAYCQLICSTHLGRKRCRESRIVLGMKAMKCQKIAWQICHGGLVDISSPIVVNEVYIGQVMCSQVLFNKPEPEKLVHEMGKRSRELKLDYNLLMKHFEEIGTVPPKHLFACAELLNIIGNYVVQCGIKSATERELREKELQIMEINARRIQLEKTLKELELKNLQSQVNPHFLFNALNTIARSAMFENADSTQDIIYNLAQLLRYSLRKINMPVSLADELDYVNNYLTIQKKRFGKRIRYKIDVPAEVLGFRMPAITLQPLIENAVIHGLEPKRQGGMILIRGKVKDPDLLIEIIDSGLGISPERVKEISHDEFEATGQGHSTGIGLANVKKRLFDYFNDRAKIIIESKEKYWTKISLFFPYV